MKEIWRDIKGYEGLYQISNVGRVKSMERKVRSYPQPSGFRIKRERILSPTTNKHGYLYVNLSKNKRNFYPYVHRLVIEAFADYISDDMECNHIDGDKHNNNIENLQWTTHKDNIWHAIRNGLIKNSKEDSNMAKLTRFEVSCIRKYLKNFPYITQVELSKWFGVSPMTISRIKNNKSWVGVPAKPIDKRYNCGPTPVKRSNSTKF